MTILSNLIEKKGYRVSIHDTNSVCAQQKTQKAKKKVHLLLLLIYDFNLFIGNILES